MFTKLPPNVLATRELWLGHVYPLVINKDTWDRLAKEDKAAIQRAAEIAYKTLGSVMDSSFDTQIEDLEKSGARVRILELRELEQWKTATRYQEIQAAWVKEQVGKGIKDIGSTMEKISAIMNDVVQ